MDGCVCDFVGARVYERWFGSVYGCRGKENCMCLYVCLVLYEGVIFIFL